jgi:hypothetical protein
MMGRYNVIAPCIVDDKHYTRAHPDPVDVDDAVAAPLVEEGVLVVFELPAADEPAEPEQPRPQPPTAESLQRVRGRTTDPAPAPASEE